MRNRSALQANDLLDIVDFIKNEEKYTARINELKAIEARLLEQNSIADTLEKALALQDQNEIIQKKLAEDRASLEAAFKEKTRLLDVEHKKKMEALELQSSRLYMKSDEVGRQLDSLRDRQSGLDQEALKLQASWTNLNKREMGLAEREDTLQKKLVAVKQLLGE